MARNPKPWFHNQSGWWCTTLEGKRKRLARGKKNKAEAQRVFQELLYLQQCLPVPEAVAEHTVVSVIELYLTHAKKHLAVATFELRKRYLQAFAESHGFRKVSACIPYHLESWLDASPDWKTDWTRSTLVKTVQVAFNWAEKQGLIAKNPFKGVSQRQGQPHRPLTDEEFRALLRAACGRKSRKRPSPAARFRQVLVFLRLTGCRPGELCQLTWKDVDLDKAVITLHQHKTSRTQRKPKPRVIHLTDVAVKLLKYVKGLQEPGEFVFRTYRGTPWNKNSLSLRMQRARKNAGIPKDAKLYGLRHAFGTRAVVNGVPIKTVAQLMGHNTTRMTEHYVHLADQEAHLAAAMRQANGSGLG